MRLELLVSHILRIGMVISIALITLGMLLLFVRGGSLGYPLDTLVNPYNTSVNTYTIDYNLLCRGLASFESLSIVLLGLIVMVSTPILRIILCTLVFASEKDRIYIAIAMITLILILSSIFLIPRIL
ncbi:MAG: DUF1634 domain-containing protein [Candidatus Bathyarchaeia archaeon]